MKKLLYSMLCMLALCVAACQEVEPEPTPQDPVENPSENPGENSGEKPEETPVVTLTAGEITENQVEFYLSAEDADEVAYGYVIAAEEAQELTAEALFDGEYVFAATADPIAHVISDLTAATEYIIYAAARADVDDEVLYGEVKKLTVTTAEGPKFLELVSTSKTGFSYKVNAEEGDTFYHTYFEGWFFEYNYELNKYYAELEGVEFDPTVFVWNLLAQYGEMTEMNASNGGVIEWYAGKENVGRDSEAFLVPGETYYAVAALIAPSGAEWLSTPSIISFDMEEPGVSPYTAECSVYDVNPYSASLRMEIDETVVNFIMWDLFPLNQYKMYVADYGKEWIMDYVSEYSLDKGQARTNSYTDTWTVTPGSSYMLCVYGVDYNGDEFYTEMQVNVPLPEPSMNLYMAPYERELEGYTTYNTLKLSGSFADFVGLDYESSVYFLAGGPVEKTVFDEAVAAAGLSGTAEELQANGEMMYTVGQSIGLSSVAADEDILAQLKEGNSFDKIYTELKPDTEYVNMMIAMYDGEVICRLASAKTDPAPVDVVESDAYKAFLGNWTVTGKQTADWSTYASYNLTFERLTSNRSFLVYGWSSQQVGQDFPFVANFNESTGKISIQTPQVLGTVTIEDYEYEIHFVGKAKRSGYDDLIVLSEYDGIAYTGKVNEPYLTLLSEFFQYAGEWKEYMSMSYVLYDPVRKEYYGLEPYDLVYFQTMRAD